MAGETLNFAIAGCGSISATHIKALDGLAGARLYAFCDTNRDSAAALARAHGGKAYGDYQELLRDPDVDIVDILTPSGMHADMGIAAARAGKHVVVEKPLDIDLQKARALIGACEENGVSLSCIFQHRFDPDILALKKAVENGSLGTLNSCCCHTKWYRPQEYYDQVAWRGTKALDGGGALMNQSIHYVDMMLHIMGPVEEVYGYAATRAHQRIDVEDVAMAAIRFKNGAIGVLEANVTAYPGFYTRLDVCGSDGTVIIENNTAKEWQLKSGAMAEKAEAELPHRAQMRDIIESVKQGVPSLVSGLEAIKSLELVLAVYQSCATGKPVRLGE
jgi:predicted dehydrogenase